MSFHDQLHRFGHWSADDEAKLAATKVRFPVGSVHLFKSKLQTDVEKVFVILEEAHLANFERLGRLAHEEVNTYVIVRYLDLSTGDRLSFYATSDIDRLSERIA